MQPATQSTGSVVYLVDGIIDPIQQQKVPESLIQLNCYHLTGEATWKVSVYLVCIIDIDMNLCIEK